MAAGEKTEAVERFWHSAKRKAPPVRTTDGALLRNQRREAKNLCAALQTCALGNGSGNKEPRSVADERGSLQGSVKEVVTMRRSGAL